MSKEFEKLMYAHERSDKDYVNVREEVLARVKEEFENAEEFISMLDNDEKAEKAFFDYSATKPYIFSVIPVRKSDRLYVKKHTFTQRPYYHYHTFYEIIVVVKGNCGYFTYPDGDKHEIAKGDVCIVSPGAAHALARSGKKDIILKVVVPEKTVKEIFGENSPLNSAGIKIFENSGDRALSYFQNFTREHACESTFSEIAAKGWFALFITELFRIKREKCGDIVEKFNKYTSGNLTGASLSGFAKFAGYNADHVSRMLKRETGRTFKELIADKRLSKAKELLKHSDITVESIAAETGYQNTSGFYKQFTASYGITPAKYRKSER